MKSSILVVVVLTIVATVSIAQAQGTWEGPTGVFLNPLAFTLAQGQTSVSTHYLNLQPAGALTTYGVTYGAAKNFEIGLTRADLSVGGISAINIAHAKYIILPAKGEAPAVGVGVIARETEGGPSTDDIYAVATEVFPTKTPIIASVTVRNTNGLGSGLFGKDDDRSTEVGAFLGVVAKPKLIVGVEYYGQPDADAWKDVAVRYSFDPNTNVDLGLARINSTFKDQVAFALTHRF